LVRRFKKNRRDAPRRVRMPPLGHWRPYLAVCPHPLRCTPAKFKDMRFDKVKSQIVSQYQPKIETKNKTKSMKAQKTTYDTPPTEPNRTSGLGVVRVTGNTNLNLNLNLPFEPHRTGFACSESDRHRH